jgi:tetratricopeptide (TPR) repeat protein
MMRGTTRGTAGGLLVIAVLAVSTSLLVSWKTRRDRAHLRALLTAEIDRGSLVGLGRAQAIGRRVVLADPSDAEAAALLVYTGALLATEMGQGRVNEAESAAASVEAASGRSPNAGAVAGAARALLALRKGDFAGALTRATAAAAVGGDTPYARCALGRVRAATGDLVGASHALAAAMVQAPDFLPAKIAWAEVRLDLGDVAAAQAVLAPIVARAPEDVRARMLLDEASQALAADPAAGTATGRAPAAQPADAGLASVCNVNGPMQPYLVASCALAWSTRARFEGDRFRASAQAQAAARVVPDEPRMLARTAQLLAQQGAVDRAEQLFERAAHLAGPQMPALAWARLAITLGHGRAATAPPGLRPVNAMTRVLAARAALAAGGAGALGAALDGYGPQVVSRDADLRLLESVVKPTAPDGGPARGKISSAQHYVEGLRERLGGDLLGAAEHLSHALAGHADACRAAGEYIATLRSLKRHPDGTAFTALRAENKECVDLPRQ